MAYLCIWRMVAAWVCTVSYKVFKVERTTGYIPHQSVKHISAHVGDSSSTSKIEESCVRIIREKHRLWHNPAGRTGTSRHSP
eukprot:9498537-Pyramimonas_sp.AAC.2